MTPARRAALGLVLGGLLSSAAASAQPRPVALTVSGPEAEAALLTASFGELLHRLGAELVAGADAGVPGAVATASVEFAADEGRLSLADGEGRVVLYRRIPRKTSSAVLVEAVAHVLHSAVAELLEPRRVIGSPAPPMVQATAAEPERDDSRVGLELGAYVGGRAFERTALVVSAGVQASVSLRVGALRPALSLLATYNSPFDATSALVDLRTQSLSLRLLPTVLLLERSWLSLEAGAGGGADLLFTQARSRELPLGLLTRDRVDPVAVLTALLAARLSVSDNTDVTLALMLDVDLAPRRFVTDVAGVRGVVFAPWRLRPAVVAGFSFGAAGARPHGGAR